MKNKGITLIVLVITIVVMVILATAIIATATNVVSQTKRDKFEHQIKQIQDASSSYYMLNNAIAQKDNTMSKSEVLALVGSQSTKFNEEVVLNKDDSSILWYKLDLKKIGIKGSNYGKLKTPNDVFVVAYPSLNVYYLKGEKFENEIFFSLSSKFVGINKVNENSEKEVDTSTVTTQSFAGINVYYSNAIYTNDIKAVIKTNMATGEELYMKVSDKGADKKITTVIGNNTLKFSNLNSIISKKAEITVPLDLNDKANFENAINSLKYIDIIKKKAGIEIGRVRINCSNLDETLPVITKSNVEIYDNMKLLSLNVQDTLSNISEVKYEYIIQKDKMGQEIINNKVILIDNSLPREYIQTKAKKINFSDKKIYIKVPLDVLEMVVVAIDKAGNYSQLYVVF
ncbi:MAG: type II secretion system protein [Clostridia bacterium]